MIRIQLLLIGLIGSCCWLSTCKSDTANSKDSMDQYLPADVWVGTYTRTEGHVDGKAAGIYHASLQTDTAQLLHVQAEIVNPSFIAKHPNGKVLYAVSEIGAPSVDSNGWVYSYRIQNGKLEPLNRQSTYSFAPCHVSVHPGGQWLYVANYVGGMIVRYPLNGQGEISAASDTLRLTGSGPNTRQDSSHPHAVTVSPDGQWVVVTDLGTDRIHTFRAEGAAWEEITYVDMPPGSGPRHFAFHPTGPFAYVFNELTNTVTALHYNAENGALQIREQYATLPSDFTGMSLGADIHLTPNGQFLYASNRGHNALAAFEVLPDGLLQPIGHYPTQGDFPRNFAIHPSGEYLLVANQNTDNVVQMAIDPQQGYLKVLREWGVKTPVCLQF